MVGFISKRMDDSVRRVVDTHAKDKILATVIPAQAGIYTISQVALCYGFPPARER